MVDAHALARLVGDVARFLEVNWGRAPVLVRAVDRGRTAEPGAGELLSLDDVDRLVAATGLRAPGFRLVKQGTTLPQASLTRHVRIGSRPVSDLIDVAAVHAAVADGATLVLQGLHRSFAPVAAFCRGLERTLTAPVQANAYLTPPVAQGLELHEDPHDVFAVQTYGRKRWVVHPPGGGTPWDLELEPGDVLYLPTGTLHAAQTVGSPSLHLTIGVRTVTWRRLVDRALAEVLADMEDLDAPLPAGWADEPAALEDRLRSRLEDLRAALADADAGGALRGEAEALDRSQPPDLRGGLLDLLELDALDHTTLLRIRPGTVWRIETPADAPDAVQLRLADRTIRAPAAVGAVLRRMADAGRFRPGDLGELIDRPSSLVLCRRLVREGALTVVRDPTIDPSGV